MQQGGTIRVTYWTGQRAETAGDGQLVYEEANRDEAVTYVSRSGRAAPLDVDSLTFI